MYGRNRFIEKMVERLNGFEEERTRKHLPSKKVD